MCQHRIYRMFFPPSSPVRTTLLSLLSDIFMRHILNPSFPLPLTYVCCFSCWIPMGQNHRNKFASNQVKLKIATSLASGQSAPTSFCFPFHSCLCPPCLAISYTRISTGPSHHKSGSLNNKYHSTLSKHSTKISCQCTNPFHHLVRATPKTNRKPFRGHGRRCRPRPPWPQQRSAARPRRRGRSQPPHAAPCCLERRGCDADGGRLRLPSRTKRIVMGCFSGWLGKVVDR